MSIYDDRPLWVEVRWWWRRWSSIMRAFARRMLWVVVTRALVAFIIVSAGLAGLHYYNQMPLGDAVRGVVDDYRIAYHCAPNTAAVWAFWDRKAVADPATARNIRMLDVYPVTKVCAHGRDQSK